MIVSAGTLRGAMSGQLFVAPCLADLRVPDEDRGAGKAA